MADRNLPHIFVPAAPKAEPFTIRSTAQGGNRPNFSGDRMQHGRRLSGELTRALQPLDEDPEMGGIRITFASFPELELALESLESLGSGEQPRLLSVSVIETESGAVQQATVFIPRGRREYFLRRLTAYVETASLDTARHSKLVEGIESIRRATIKELWTDASEEFPADPNEVRWWEVWLLSSQGPEIQRIVDYAVRHNLATSEHFLGFNDRTVAMIRATTLQLAEAVDSIDDIAELRRPRDVADFVAEMPASEQAEWVDELLNRTTVARGDVPVVCVLDSGVQDSHPLLAGSLDPSDMHAIDSSWGSRPSIGSQWNAHGTEMAGLALFENLQEAVTSSAPVALQHRLESVKIFPNAGANQRQLFGAVTARAVDRPEIQDANRDRVFMLAVTEENLKLTDANVEPTENDFAGRPTSWSAAIDTLAFGRAVTETSSGLINLDRDAERRPRLFVVSAGNIRDVRASDNHLARSDLEPIENPSQAWNALTVGAYSEHDHMGSAHVAFAGYRPIAPRGELSPVSRTSVVFNRKKWPVKPDVVANGGNLASSPDGSTVDTPPNLRLLTTRLQQGSTGSFTLTGDTSAATAQVAAIAADIHAAYPELRPETVRGLIVHSAEWTDAMSRHINSQSNRTQRISLVRRYGMGVPDSTRAISSAVDALTLVSESLIHPYELAEDGSTRRAREMNFHELPWPTDVLEELGEASVRLRVTLSYFVEPNPSNRGWAGRYSYPSHGLRFAVKRPEDSTDAFRSRINARIGDSPPRLSTEAGWLLGVNHQQSPGSLHTDIWTGTAAELASKGEIAVYPIAGWWKYKKHSDQSEQGVNYSLIVSIESPEVEVDLYTPVELAISTEIETTV